MTKFKNLDPEEKILEFIDQDALFEHEMDRVLSDPDAVAVSSMSEQELAEELRDIEGTVAAKIELVAEMVGGKRIPLSETYDPAPANSNVPSRRDVKVKRIAFRAASLAVVLLSLPAGWLALGLEFTGEATHRKGEAIDHLLSTNLLNGKPSRGPLFFSEDTRWLSVTLEKAPRVVASPLDQPAAEAFITTKSGVEKLAERGSHSIRLLEQRLVELATKIDAVSDQQKKVDEIYAMLAVERGWNPAGFDILVQTPQIANLEHSLWSVQPIVDNTKKPKALGLEVPNLDRRTILDAWDVSKAVDVSLIGWNGN
ncbi:hypothetical protein RU07_11775 [Agrobacterium tumefaciens]|uniref:Uncharacterized protein n=1 Tax=Agrobacterium tumefaciens TaxID=358 RepID=A0A0D0J913_AGRTU|nr:hypothetical protein RU07_11775 [Agrobacterium tumefaciens]